MKSRTKAPFNAWRGASGQSMSPRFGRPRYIPSVIANRIKNVDAMVKGRRPANFPYSSEISRGRESNPHLAVLNQLRISGQPAPCGRHIRQRKQENWP